MPNEPTEILVKDISLPVGTTPEEACAEAAKRLSLSSSELIRADIHRRSIDARRRGGKDPTFVFSVNVSCRVSDKKLERLKALRGIEIIHREPLVIPRAKSDIRPVIVGFGPAGMFAALILAESGMRPIVIERGANVKERQAAVDRFMRTGVLDTSTNIQFGAGGAGTFSDGKLVTRINDPICRYVLEKFHEFGAPEEILTLAKPHVGTDRLLDVVGNIEKRVTELGGEIRFLTRLDDMRINNGKVESITVEDNNGRYDLKTDALILAVGHSARDTFDMLSGKGIDMTTKPFSVGVRVEHLQADLDHSLYGKFADMSDKYSRPLLPHAEYNVSWREKQQGLVSDTARGVYSFCMCPGGEVVAATSEEGGVVTNGMSRYARDGRNGNSAIAVSVLPEDIGKDWKKAIEFQRMIERSAFRAGGNDYSAPVETLGDFLSGKTSRFTEPSRVVPTYMNGKYRLCDIGGIFPGFVTDMLKKGFRRFGGMIKGFDMPEAVLTGAETRTSSPVRIPRNDGFTTSKVGNLYPCGEGAGYAGGITSAAVDGIRTAIMVIGNN